MAIELNEETRKEAVASIYNRGVHDACERMQTRELPVLRLSIEQL